MRIEKITAGVLALLVYALSAGLSLGNGGSSASPSDLATTKSIVELAPEVPQSGDVTGDSHSHYAPRFSSGAVEQGFSPYPPSGSSGVSALLGYMTCDPHSCPQVWVGYDAQRLSDLRRKCSQHGPCSLGCGCGGTQHHSSVCNGCGSGVVKNRYRHAAVSVGCGNCTSSGQTCGCDIAMIQGTSASSQPSQPSSVATKALVPSFQQGYSFSR
jgi:hypothetical protein